MNEIQEALLEMMVDFDAVMRKHDVDYFLAYGTVLGAVRHKGFIPWDDDVDLIVRKRDLQGFIGAMEELESTGKYELQRPFSVDWPYLFYKVRLNGSTAIEDKFVDTRIHQGLFIDVFILEPYPDSKFRRMLFNTMGTFQHGLQTLCDYRMGKRFDPIFRVICFGETILNRMMDYVCEQDSEWNKVRSYDEGFEVFRTEDFEETTEMEFEGHRFTGMKEYDRFLKNCFGDYMTLPPEEERVSHHLSFFDRNLDYRDWLKTRKG